MPDTDDDSRNFTWVEAPVDRARSWLVVLAAIVAVGLLIGVLIAVCGFIVLRIYG